jgi:hypothetical protein
MTGCSRVVVKVREGLSVTKGAKQGECDGRIVFHSPQLMLRIQLLIESLRISSEFCDRFLR